MAECVARGPRSPRPVPTPVSCERQPRLRLSTGCGGRFLEAVVAPKKLVADRDRGDAGDAPGERLLGVICQPLLDLGPLDGFLDLLRVKARLTGDLANVVELCEREDLD